jgi:hypothetical protein
VRSKGALQNRGLSPKKKKSRRKMGGEGFLWPAGCTCGAVPDQEGIARQMGVGREEKWQKGSLTELGAKGDQA